MADESRLEQILRSLATTSGNPDTPERPAEQHPDDELVAALLDGTLDEADAAEVRRHLAECPACFTAFAALKETESIDGPPVPAALLAAARNLVREPLGRAVASIALRLVKGAMELVSVSGASGTPRLAMAAEAMRSAGAKPAAAGRTELLSLTPSLPHVETLTFQKIEPEDVRILVEPSAGIGAGGGKAKSANGAAGDSAAVDRAAGAGRAETSGAGGGAAITVRIDLFREATLMQSWPLEADTVALEPVTLGRYTLNVMEHEVTVTASAAETAAGVCPTGVRGTVVGSIEIELSG